ncbi:MAG: hypothetical protein JXR70_14120 [Spirochaetales bacterium]|nr:hypothetical protein [Spirochaetales bacterium]
MIFKIEENTKEEQLKKLKETKDKEIILDLENIQFLTSKDISRLLIAVKGGKKISFVNSNEHIKETIAVLNLQNIINI